MRVLHVYRTFFPDSQGGLEETIRQIAINTREFGVEPHVFTISRNPDPATVTVDGVTVHRVRQTFEYASCNVSLTGFGCFNRLVESSDLIHYHFPWPFADVLHLGCRVRKPAIVTYHSDIVRQAVLRRLYAPLMRRFLGSLDRIVCTSPNYYATSPTLADFDQKVSVIPIGIDEASYEIPDSVVTARTAGQYGSDFFLFVGVLRYYKGLHTLLDAMVDAPYRVVIVGAGPIEEELMAHAKRLGLSNVVFAGRLSNEEKVALFQLCRGVVFPSLFRSEAFGVTLLEGAMYGKPLISTEVGTGTSHVNVNGVTGLVVSPGSPSALRQAMDTLWHDEELAIRLGQQARRRYESHFTGIDMGRRYTELYEQLHAP